MEEGTLRVTQWNESRATDFPSNLGILDKNLAIAVFVSLAGLCKKPCCLNTEGRVRVSACSLYACDLSGEKMLRNSSLCSYHGNIRMYGSLHS